MRPLLARALFLVAAGSALAVACVEVDSYVYSAHKYDSANACVGDYHSIEVIDGTGAKSTCPKACLEVNCALYVSTVCPPLPAIATPVASASPDCKAALAAPACSEPSDGGEGEGGDAADEDSGEADADPDSSTQQDTGPIVDASDAG